MSGNKRIFYKRTTYALLSVLVMAVIYLFSAQSGAVSGELSGKVGGFLRETLKIFLPEETVDFLAELIPVRKCAHVFLYLCLGTTVTLFFYTFSFRRQRAYFLLPILVCFLYACFDELHQTFVTDRTGQFSDVLVDSVGFLTANIILFGIKKWRRGIDFSDRS